jgi:hypothetical protein
MSTLAHFQRLPITLPCPVPIEAGTGRAIGDDGQPIPLKERTELCAVDAGWMIGAQVMCDYHLRQIFDNGWMEGTYEELVAEAYEEWPERIPEVVADSLRPWSERRRYSQEQAAMSKPERVGAGEQT